MNIKKIVATLIIFIFLFSVLTDTFAKDYDITKTIISSKITRSGGDVNVDGGGGGDYDGTSGSETNILGTVRDEGVRVTLVKADTGQQVTTPVDFANNPRSPIEMHFGKVSKISYINGSSLSIKTNKYYAEVPNTKLPTIVNGDLQTIKDYFRDEGFLKYFASITNFNYETMINGDYKILLEPIGYPKIKGKIWACTATELAMYNKLLNGDIRSKIVTFSHRNLPLSMFLEVADLGIQSYTGSKFQSQTDDVIKSKLGVGIISFKENVDITTPDTDVKFDEYVYRTDTEVYTSIELSGGLVAVEDRVFPRDVTFNILGTDYKADNKDVVYPNGGNALAYIKWTTPTEPQEFTINVTVNYEKATSIAKGLHRSYVDTTESVTENYQIPVKVVKLEEIQPPNPTADDRNKTWRMKKENMLNLEENLQRSWVEHTYYWYPVIKTWTVTNPDGSKKEESVDIGHYRFNSVTYLVKLDATMELLPDNNNPTAKGKKMKSGYGVTQNVLTKLTRTSDGGSHALATPIQNGFSTFSEFGFKDYNRVLELTDKKARESKFEFKVNRFSTLGSRVHFTPIWYPDKKDYIVSTYVFDSWTPAGMISANLNDSVYIDGNVWQDWTVRPLPTR